jgi:hypothetical protein
MSALPNPTVQSDDLRAFGGGFGAKFRHPSPFIHRGPVHAEGSRIGAWGVMFWSMPPF